MIRRFFSLALVAIDDYFRKSASALACAFLVWASLTIVLPAGASIRSNLIAHVPSFNDLNTRIGSARASADTGRCWMNFNQ